MSTTTEIGDCLKALAEVADDTYDSIVTDPPYGISFMGKGWDHGVPGEEFWTEILRVAKPGAHLLAFGGTRTHHRLMVAIEDSGWEIRDCMMWLYGQGFPKSHNVSKAIDKATGAEREVVGVDESRAARLVNQTGEYATAAGWAAGNRSAEITAPATPEAHQWDGWGTALKPAWEIVIAAQKPGDWSKVDGSLTALEAELWSMLSASGVELPSPSSPPVSGEGMFDGARWSAEQPTNTQVGSFDQMGTFSYDDVTAICWNTVRSWRITLAALSELMSTSTIATETSQTIDWATLWSLIEEITPESIIQAVTSRGGSRSSVSTVALAFSDVAMRLSAILTLSVRGPATSPERTPLPAEGVDSPAWEPIIVARKPFSGTVAANVLEHGTGAINIDASRIGYVSESEMDAVKRRSGGGSSSAGYAAGSGDTFHQSWKDRDAGPSQTGRFPANLVLSHTPECRDVGTSSEVVGGGAGMSDTGEASALLGGGGYEKGDGFEGRSVETVVWECSPECPVRQLDEQTGTLTSGKPGKRGKKGEINSSAAYGAESRKAGGPMTGFGDSGGASRFFYTAKASKKERNEGLPEGMVNKHPTVKPIALMRYLVRMVTPPGGTVLDPFMGSGTTGVAAIREGFDFVGIDNDAESVETANARLKHEQKGTSGPTLF